MPDPFINGISVKVGDGGDPTEIFTKIPKVLSLSGIPSLTHDTVDITSMDSGGVREYISGLADGGDLEIECNHIMGDTTQDQLTADCDAGTTRNMQIELTDGTSTATYSFAMVCTSAKIAPSMEDKAVITYSGKITGAITKA